MDIHLLDSQGATVGDWQVWQALVGSLRTFRGQPEDLQWEEVLRSNALTRALTPTDARRIWTHVVQSFGFDDRPFHVQLRELSRIFSEDDAVEGDYRLFREQKDVFPFPLGSPSGSPTKSPSPVAVGRKLELFEPLFDPMKPFTAPVMPMKASVADSAMPGHLINFVRFLRLRAAEEAWQQRHASEHVSALLGRSLEAQELPLWAKEGGALHMAAKTRRDKDDMKEEKGKENKENEGKEGKEASEGAAFEVFRRYLFSSSPQLADPGEVPELERLESLWPLYVRFQRQQSECEVMWLSESSELTSHAWQRESFMLRMMKVLPELAASHWHCFLARLLMSLHNDVLLFVGIQLPFLAFEASRPSTQGRFSAQICDDADVPHPYGLWAATERFLCLAGVDSHTAELKTRDLRHRSVALLDAAPELWQAQNLSDELTVLLAQSCDEADFSSVLAAIRATREEFLMEEVEELRSLAGGFQWKELIEELVGEGEAPSLLHLRREELPEAFEWNGLAKDFSRWSLYLEEEASYQDPVAIAMRGADFQLAKLPWRRELCQGIQKYSSVTMSTVAASAVSSEQMREGLKQLKMPLWSALKALDAQQTHLKKKRERAESS